MEGTLEIHAIFTQTLGVIGGMVNYQWLFDILRARVTPKTRKFPTIFVWESVVREIFLDIFFPVAAFEPNFF